MTKPVAWSHSALNSYETCPRRHYLTKVSKEVPDPPGATATHGLTVHKAFEARLRERTPLPPTLEQFDSFVTILLRKQGELLVEQQWAIDRSFRPVAWFDKSVWCRAVIDAGKVQGERAVLFDWKTGKRKMDSDQLKLSAGMAFARFPQVQTVVTGFVWLGAQKLDQETYHRAQVGDIWGTFLPRVARLEVATQENRWEPRPSGLCRNYCPVPKNRCEFRS